jgi:adenylate kinase
MLESQKHAVIFVGPPGSGKDTQAGILVEEFGMVQMPSSQIIRKAFADNPDDPVIQKEKILFDTGKWNSPDFVAGLMLDFIRACAAQGKGIIFSGSPRTVPEAEVEIPELAKLYGMDHITILHLNLDKDEARRRNITRRMCRANSHPFPSTPEFSHLKVCPKDGSELYTRAIDNAEIFEVRWNEHVTRTEPCIEVFTKAGLTVHEIDASETIQGIHQEIIGILERQHEPVPQE